MKKSSVFAISAAIIAIIGDFVPYYYTSWDGYGELHQYTVTLFNEDILGIAVLVVSALIILFTLIRKRIPLIISSIMLMIVELIFIFVTLTEGDIYILSVPERGLLLLPGFYIAVAAVVLSLISIIKNKKMSNSIIVDK